MNEWDNYIDTYENFDQLNDLFKSLKNLGIVVNFLFDYWEQDLLFENFKFMYYTEAMVDIEIWTEGGYWAQNRHKGF